MNDNELSILELIHLFVEVLDGYFGNVCELDLVFHFDKAFELSTKQKEKSIPVLVRFKRVFLMSFLENNKLNMSWSSFKVFQSCLNLLSCWKKHPALTVEVDDFWSTFSLRFQVYRILDELLLAGEVSETSTSKIIAIMKSVDKMDWCHWRLQRTIYIRIYIHISVRWVEADNKSSLNVNDPFLIYNFYVRIYVYIYYMYYVSIE